MKYKQLIEKLQNLTPEQLDMDVIVFENAEGQMMSAIHNGLDTYGNVEDIYIEMQIDGGADENDIEEIETLLNLKGDNHPVIVVTL